jgi:hypothetical protein
MAARFTNDAAARWRWVRRIRQGDSVTSTAALTVTRASGQVETYPTGTALIVGG